MSLIKDWIYGRQPLYNYINHSVAGVGVVTMAFDQAARDMAYVGGAGAVPNRMQFQVTAPYPNYGPKSWAVGGIPQPAGTFFNAPQMVVGSNVPRSA